MPQLIFKNLEKNKIEEKCQLLLNELSEKAGINKEYISIEVPNTEYLVKPEFSICEVLMFDREDDVKDSMAKIIYEVMEVKNLDVYFLIIGDNNYYENGKKF